MGRQDSKGVRKKQGKESIMRESNHNDTIIHLYPTQTERFGLIRIIDLTS